MRYTKLVILLLLAMFSLQTSAQKIIFPVYKGSESDGGAVVAYDLSTNQASSTSFAGVPEAGDFNVKSGEIGGLKYISSKHAIYGIASNGATPALRVSAYGAIFKYDINTKQFTTIKTFENNGSDGAKPIKELTLHNNRLYGICQSGGLNNDGVIFYIDLLDDSYHVEFNFKQSTTGALPTSKLVLQGNYLYGGTKSSTDGFGSTVYRYNLTTKKHTLLFNLTGQNPVRFNVPDIMIRGSYLYFIWGGFTIYQMLLDGSNRTTYHSFFGNNIHQGIYPVAFSYSNNNGKWYILCHNGGANGKGSICEMTFSGSKVVNRHSFSAAEMQLPVDGLIDLNNGDLMGVTPTYNGNGYGAIYTFSTNNYIVSTVRQFQGTDGALAETKPVKVANKIYGFTNRGGLLKCGVMYTYDLATQQFEQDIDLGHELGKAPICNLLYVDNNEYIGVANRGLRDNKGGLYKYDGLTHVVKEGYSIDNPDIYDLRSNIVAYDNKYYGVAILVEGVQDDYESTSALYEFDPITKKYNIIGSLDSNGLKTGLTRSIFYGNLVLDGSSLYGATEKGLFKYDLKNKRNKVNYVRDFVKNTHGVFTAYLTVMGRKIYGANYDGGANGTGTLFSYDMDAYTFTILKDFTSNISTPYLGFDINGDNIYGMFEGAGTKNHGGIYKYTFSNGTLQEVASFDSVSTGNKPISQLFMASDSMYYGVNEEGGAMNNGALFQFDPKNNILSNKIDLTEKLGYGGYNIFFRELKDPTSITSIGNSNNDIEIYPNPSDGTFKIELSERINTGDLIVFDIAGRVVKRVHLDEQSNLFISLNDAPEGVYIIEIRNKSNILHERVLLKR